MEDRDKKKAAEVLKEIDSNLDTVLFQFTPRAHEVTKHEYPGRKPRGKVSL